MENFTPISGLIGGGLIGLGAALYIVVLGRIAGISGIIGGLFSRVRTDVAMRIAFIAGLVIGPFLVMLVRGPVPDIHIEASWPVLVIAGLLVGYGTRLGSGCTSGHGVCGMARMSPRSLAATGIFMAVGFLTVFITRHVLGG